CMSNGLKNLQSAARAAARRDRLESGALSGYDDDSGISGMGLTPVDELDASYSSPETSVSSIVAPASNSYQQMQPHHMANAVHYNLSAAYAPGYGGHGYSSSVSSNASVGHYGHHQSQGNSPQYMTQRPQSSDMGIGNLINRPGRGV
ncbi:unnamed protein product, partial [Fusarium graminearum]